MAEPGRPPADASAANARWFVALRPERDACVRLQRIGERIARAIGGRVVPARRIHLTLAFIGGAPRALEAPLRGLVAALPPPGALALGRLGSFDGRLVWIAPDEPPAGTRDAATDWLAAEADALRCGLDALGVAHDRKRFVAHVTLLRDARPAGRDAIEALARTIEPVEVRRPTLHLVESRQDRDGLHYDFL